MRGIFQGCAVLSRTMAILCSAKATREVQSAKVGERRRAVTAGAIPYRRVQNPRRPSQGTEDSSRDVPER